MKSLLHTTSMKLRNKIQCSPNGLFLYFSVFSLGVFWGSMASSQMFSVYSLSHSGFDKANLSLLFFVLALIFSTSYLGFIFIPLILFIRGFLFSAFLSSVYVFSYDNGFVSALVYEALPALICLPCFLLIANDCVLLSRKLFHVGSFHCNYGRVPILRHILISIVCLLIDYIYCIYIMPLLLA